MLSIKKIKLIELAKFQYAHTLKDAIPHYKILALFQPLNLKYH